MSENSSKIHLKVGEIEISIEGTPDFVAKQYQQMEKELSLGKKLTDALSGTSVKRKELEGQKETGSVSKKASKAVKSAKAASKAVKENFEEWLEQMPKGLKNRDKALVAGYFNQLNSSNNMFRVRDMNNTLKKHGIKITNPSSLIKNVAKSKQIIQQVTREGRQVYYQFTNEGEGYIKDLLSAYKK
jgi:hypothetical protein